MGSDNREMVDACFRRMVEELGAEAGRAAVAIMVDSLGGLRVYVPSARTLELEARNRAIRAAFNGENHRELMLRFRVEKKELRRILGRKG